MGREQVVIRVSSDGAIHAETIGIKGSKCIDTIALLENMLEAQTVTSSFTEEYEQMQTNTQKNAEVDDELRQL